MLQVPNDPQQGQLATVSPDKSVASGQQSQTHNANDVVVQESKTFVRSSNPTEASQGYAQLVRAGPLIYISGVSALDSHSGQMPAHLVLEAAGQTRAIMRRVRQLLETVGCSEKSIVRMRIYVIDMARDSRQIQLAMTQWLNESVEAAGMKPGITIVEVRRLSSEPVLLEVEVDAVSL